MQKNLVSAVSYENERKLLIVVSKIKFNELHEIKQIFKGFIPLILSEDEVKGGSDVFPLEFLNIKETGRLVFGKDYFKKYKVKKKDVRLQLEFELRSKLILLRERYLESKSKQDLKAIIDSAISTILPLCRGLLYLKTTKLAKTEAEIIEKVCAKYKVNCEVVQNLYKGVLDNYDSLISGLIDFLSEFCEKVDKMVIK